MKALDSVALKAALMIIFYTEGIAVICSVITHFYICVAFWRLQPSVSHRAPDSVAKQLETISPLRLKLVNIYC